MFGGFLLLGGRAGDLVGAQADLPGGRGAVLVRFAAVRALQLVGDVRAHFWDERQGSGGWECDNMFCCVRRNAVYAKHPWS